MKVIKWFDYLWLTQKCSDEERAVSCLPDKLKVNTNTQPCIIGIYAVLIAVYKQQIYLLIKN